MSVDACPTEDQLYAIVAGEGSEAETTHVAVCNDCQAQLRKLQTEATILRHVGEQARSGASVSATTSDPAMIGKFIVVGIWDDNSSFITYRGLHAIVSQEVLIQVAKAPRCAESAFQEAFRAGCGRWMQQRPDVAPVVDAGTYEAQPFFAVKFNGGVRLDRLTGEERLDGPTLVQLFGQIAQALAADAQTPHPLLRRASIVIEDDGQPTLVDWAAAAEFGADAADTSAATRNPTARLLATSFCEAVLPDGSIAAASPELQSSAKLIAELTSRQVPPAVAEIIAQATASDASNPPSLAALAAKLSRREPRRLWQRLFQRP
jgi:hypothetical protein